MLTNLCCMQLHKHFFASINGSHYLEGIRLVWPPLSGMYGRPASAGLTVDVCNCCTAQVTPDYEAQITG